MPMRILVTGDREWECFEVAKLIVEKLCFNWAVEMYGNDIVFVHGGCRGVDLSVDKACRHYSVATECHPADWSRGKHEGHARNQRMVNTKPDMTIGFHKNIIRSRGTRDCLMRSCGAGIPTYLVDNDRGEFVKLKVVEGVLTFDREAVY